MTPTGARVDPLSVAERYVATALAEGREVRMTQLFAPDATFHAPNGTIYHGRDEIAGFYREYLANRVPAFHIHRAVVEGDACWIELADGSTADPLLRASNHFTIDDDGFIVRLAIFLRPQTQT